jgi:hypothetical protein
MDGDGLSYSIGTTLVQQAGHTWNVSLRHIDINRLGDPDPRHSLSPTPQKLVDAQVSYERHFRFGRIYLGVGFEDELTQTDDSDLSGFIRWSSQ